MGPGATVDPPSAARETGIRVDRCAIGARAGVGTGEAVCVRPATADRKRTESLLVRGNLVKCQRGRQGSPTILRIACILVVVPKIHK